MSHYIIDFVNDATDADINEYLTTCGATIIKTFNAFEKVYMVEAEAMPPTTALTERVADDHDHSNHIKLLNTVSLELPTLSDEGSTLVTTSEQKDWWKVYSGSKVDLEAENFQLPLSGKGSVVYLLDSGIKLDHPEFVDSDIECLYSLLDDDFTDRKGHGTALASLIVGKNCGITDSKLKVVKLFDTEVPTKLSDFLSALDAIYVDFTSLNMYGIVNCSWEIARDEYIESKLQRLWLAGAQIVVAAGNTGTDIGNVTPAAMSDALVVGAYNSLLQPCDFSDYTGTSATSVTAGGVNGGKLAGWAPGENIYVAKLDGDYGFSSGTSMAAAIHSAILAYNVTLPAFQFDDNVNTMFNTSTVNRMTFFIKEGLLILDDAKYENSPNRISCLITDSVDTYYLIGHDIELFAAIPTQVLSRTILFNPLQFASITLHDPLPYNMHINSHGILSGYVEQIEGEMEDHTVSLTLTDHSGNSVEAELLISIRDKPTTPRKRDPNQIIPYTLNANCTSPQFCPGYCSNTGCSGFNYCACHPKRSTCFCTPPF